MSESLSQQEMIDAAIAANESGEWLEWLAWMQERGVRHVTLLPPVPIVYTGTGSLCSGTTFTSYARPMSIAAPILP